jgi:hypothetical protein
VTGASDGSLLFLRDELRAHATRAGAPLDLAIICDFAAAHLGAAVAVSIPAGPDGAFLVSAGGPKARAAEDLQLTVGEGPSREGWSEVAILLVDDLATAAQQARWPLFAPAAVESGICSLCVIPMRVGAARFGVFAVYFDQPAALTVEILADAVLLAAIALDLLLDELGTVRDGALHDGGDGHDPMSRVADRLLDDHPEIHQATGMVSVQLGVDLSEALLHLRGRAFGDGRALSDLAADVVSGTVRFFPEEDPP